DIGCGMIAVRTSLVAADLPDSLLGLRSAIEQAVPHGRSSSRGKRDKGAWHETPSDVDAHWSRLAGRFKRLTDRYPQLL
ncbi:MAG TPA: RNA-splicing ligase RtcB, partial [Pantoea sp.]|nr:RNA-splicing ligase RtcB [Pantoea sp.]